MYYDLKLRPAQPPAPAADAFTVHRRQVPATSGRDGLSLAFVHEGIGGYPLLLLHGYPETKRIWWRNISALAAAGFEVIAPDLRGHGDSDLSAVDVYDIAAYSRDAYLLVNDVLGHRRCGVVGGDVGGVVAVDMVHRFEGFVDKLVFFDTVPPLVFEDYIAAGIDPATILSDGPTGDYRRRQGETPDELAAELDPPSPSPPLSPPLAPSPPACRVRACFCGRLMTTGTTASSHSSRSSRLRPSWLARA